MLDSDWLMNIFSRKCMVKVVLGRSWSYYMSIEVERYTGRQD